MESSPESPSCRVSLSVPVLVYLIMIRYQRARLEFSLEQHNVGAAGWEAVGRRTVLNVGGRSSLFFFFSLFLQNSSSNQNARL